MNTTELAKTLHACPTCGLKGFSFVHCNTQPLPGQPGVGEVWWQLEHDLFIDGQCRLEFLGHGGTPEDLAAEWNELAPDVPEEPKPRAWFIWRPL